MAGENMGDAAAPPLPAGNAVGSRIEIAAPAAKVWHDVIDLDGWGAWNPLYTQASGKAELGETIAFTVVVPGMKPQKGKARIVAVRPNAWLHYEIVSLGGLIRAYRHIDLIELGPDRCAVTNGEIMSGLIGRLLGRLIGGKVAQGLQAMNEALKRRAEA